MKEFLKKISPKNKCDSYSKEENLIRKAIMEFIITNKRFNIVEDIKLLKLSISNEKIKMAIGNLINNNGMVVDENWNVKFVYPVSAIATKHKVMLKDGRKFYAMCAIDALGTAFTFNTDIKVESICSNSGEDVFIEIENGMLKKYYPKDLQILHVDLNKNNNWGTTC